MEKILLVDDDESFLELAKRFLEEEEYEVICAQDGEEGMKLAEEEDPDLALLDIMMPGIDGWDVYRHIKSIKPNMKISFLTSLEQLPSLNKTQAADYIVKQRPFTKEKLCGRIEGILKEE